MAKERLTMKKIREILRLGLSFGLSNRQIARSCKVSRPAVSEYVKKAREAGVSSWSEIEGLSEEELKKKLNMSKELVSAAASKPVPDYAKIQEELRNKDVTLMLLWQEYLQEHPDGLQYVQFTNLYKEYKQKLDLVMRQEHKGGEKTFVDYCDGLEVIHSETGEVKKTQMFVMVWGASNFTYAEASWGQDLANWTSSHVRAFSYFQCCPHIVVPDNLKSGVTKACRYEPEINPTYASLAEHYSFAVIPTRVRKPRDKAKVEAGVLVVQRWILAALRHRTFYSLKELNDAISELIEKLNTRPMRKLKKSRRELFEELDRSKALPIPERQWEYQEFLRAKVNIDYCVEVEKNYYTVPCRLNGERVDVRMTSTVIEVLFKGTRVASHPRCYGKYQHITNEEHMPEAHRRYSEWTPSRIIGWAAKTGACTAKVVQNILESRKHPEEGYRAALGIIRLERNYGVERVENACRRAVFYRSCSYQSVRSILARGLDRQVLPEEQTELPSIMHENIRGSEYYH